MYRITAAGDSKAQRIRAKKEKLVSELRKIGVHLDEGAIDASESEFMACLEAACATAVEGRRDEIDEKRRKRELAEAEHQAAIREILKPKPDVYAGDEENAEGMTQDGAQFSLDNVDDEPEPQVTPEEARLLVDERSAERSVASQLLSPN